VLLSCIFLPLGIKQTEISAEISCRRAEAKRLRTEAEHLITEAKARVELMILGEQDAV
jgi:hypothetical protein